MSSVIRKNIEELVDSLRLGTGLHPKTELLQVVKQTTFAPDATCPVTETGSYPGESIKTKPFVLIGSAF
jgi:hypothetical protein